MDKKVKPPAGGDQATEKSAAGSEAQRIVTAVLASKPTLFRDDLGEPYASVEHERHRESLRIGGRKFEQWVRNRHWKNNGRAVSADALGQAVATLAAKAAYEGPTKPLHNRVAGSELEAWYDLASDDWAVVRVTMDGWTVKKEVPMVFRRESHQNPQVTPVSGGKLEELLRPYLNVPDENQRLLVTVWLVTCLAPDIPHPVLVLHGDHGSAKSTLMRTLRRIIDPSKIELLSLPPKDEVIQVMAHHWCAFFDNINHLPQGMSDTLCRAVTGEGASKRSLYTDDDDKIYAYRRCIALNGINVVADAPDLLDRSILVRLERVPPEKRTTEAGLWAKFKDDLPGILGATLDTLAGAMRALPEVKLDRYPRMADFARWGCAVTRALGRDQQEFIDAYESNVSERNNEVLAGNPIAACVTELMRGRAQWTGSPGELLTELENVATTIKVRTNGEDWPKASNAMTRRLNEVRPNLAESGIRITVSRGRTRVITIEKARTAEDEVSAEEAFSVDGTTVSTVLPVASQGQDQPKLL